MAMAWGGGGGKRAVVFSTVVDMMASSPSGIGMPSGIVSDGWDNCEYEMKSIKRNRINTMLNKIKIIYHMLDEYPNHQQVKLQENR